jgi:hypothetical protein
MSFVAECKGGVINTKHPGQQSRLRQGLCETIGLSLASPFTKDRRQFVVVPRTKVTENLAQRMATQAQLAFKLPSLTGGGNVLNVVPD